MAAADPIWALVSGLPPGRREARLLYMLQAFLDLSQGHHGRPALVLGGVVAPAERWAGFSAAWQKILDEEPRIDYFNYREAERRIDQFRHWRKDAAKDKIAAFRAVIEEFEPSLFAIAFLTDAFERVMRPWGKGKHNNPYYFASGEIMGAVGRNIKTLGFEPQPIDFIFDREPMEEGTIMEGWEWTSQVFKLNPSLSLAKMFLNPPTFRNDKDVLPIQAADMFVRLTQNIVSHQLRGKPSPSWGFRKKLKVMLLTLNEDQLRNMERRRAAAYQATFGVSPYAS